MNLLRTLAFSIFFYGLSVPMVLLVPLVALLGGDSLRSYAMGWVALIAIGPLVRSLSGLGTMWLALGGGLYTIGCVFYLWRGLPYSHPIWHLFVLAATICHFFCILWYVMA